ncbi:lysosomal-associated transmembrane protein 5 isoform X2 [Pleurodeles waltl]|uniref:lysosomal-associated transmembrane protein 5 isoform X2 n=1 Tax=Pleurodeles waltl TaxID=8319 RepID=UPI0037099041
MSAQASQGPLRCCFCFSVQVSTLCLAVYHMAMSVLLMVDQSLEVVNVKEHGVSSHDYYKIDVASTFLLIIMLLLISVCLFFGVIKNMEKFLLPFVALQVLDFLLYSLTICSTYIQLPAYQQLNTLQELGPPSQDSFTAMEIVDFTLSLLSLCSSYMEIPAYLNLRCMKHMNYFPRKQALLPQRSIKMLTCISIIFLTVLVIKLFMMNCVWKCFRLIRDSRKSVTKETPKLNLPDKVLLPSYEEAIKNSSKALPPPYSLV